ncbi:hypothetical protein AB1Y20_006716 [Prymnesium parvum]|uniref:Dienelactone hydrolase domain-containing protein n=1 Tax=Prymnesium parvum TaxID=97485 RepID=A0AB34IYI9_PRYPA
MADFEQLLNSRDCCTAGAHPPKATAFSEQEPARGSFQLVDGFECYLSMPAEAPRGIVLVIHDIFGLHTGRHAHICDEFAGSGYIAVCPDLFGDGIARAQAGMFSAWPPKQVRNILDLICGCKLGFLRRTVRMSWEVDILPKIKATLLWARQLHSEVTQCFVIGFCWGGRPTARMLSMEVAATLPVPVRCGAIFHPSLRDKKETPSLIASLSRPLLLAPAGDDPPELQPGGEIAKTISARFGRPSSPAVIAFPSMIHGFMTRGPLSDPQIASEYTRGMDAALSFFQAHSA